MAAFPANLDLGSLDGSHGFKLSGIAGRDYSGGSVSAAGDVNGDGVDDVIIGARGADPNGYNSGASYVVFGAAGAFPANLGLSILDGMNGFQLSGVAAFNYSGLSVSAAGDVNGDGVDDVIIGAAGDSYVVFGKDTAAGAFQANLKLSSLDGTNGFQLSGVVAGDLSGHWVSAAGDVNGDGVDDVIIGAPGARESYVVFGKDTAATGAFPAHLEVSTLDGANGFKLDGSSSSVSAAGDINGDGVADVIIGVELDDPSGSRSGASYVVFGKDTVAAGAFPAHLELSSLDGTNGFQLSGVVAGDLSGHWVSAAGDVNGDGVDDVII
ncbi:MAG: hypothetical protein ACREU8_08860, partial [Gammaproteobacteria bacterium]